MKDSFWFKHDSGARNDPRLILLRGEFGAAGYGCYFMMLEILREAHDFKIADDEWLPASLALGFGVTEDMVKKFLARCLVLGLLKKKDNAYYSESFERRMADFIEVQKSYQERGRIGGLRKAELSHNPSPATAQLQPSSSDRIGVDKIREDKNKRFIKPTIQEVMAYCKERGRGIDAQKFYDSNEAKGWVVGKTHTPMKDWKAAIRTWEGNIPQRQMTDTEKEIAHNRAKGLI